eukprot:767834-Hanusia_phi.AAC.6
MDPDGAHGRNGAYILLGCGIEYVANRLVASKSSSPHQKASCPARPGRFCPEESQHKTEECQAGRYCEGGDAWPQPCPAGSYCPAGSHAPQKCTR